MCCILACGWTNTVVYRMFWPLALPVSWQKLLIWQLGFLGHDLTAGFPGSWSDSWVSWFMVNYGVIRRVRLSQLCVVSLSSSVMYLSLHCLLGLGKLQACPFPDVVFSPLPLSALCSCPFHCALQDGLGRLNERETWPYNCSLRLFTMVRRSSRGPNARWILARTSSLVTWSMYEMRSILK